MSSTARSEAETIEWRGTVLLWSHESWPKFDNRAQEARGFYAEASPVGTLWVAEIRGYGGVEFTAKSPSPQGTPELALESARQLLLERVRQIFGGEP